MIKQTAIMLSLFVGALIVLIGGISAIMVGTAYLLGGAGYAY